MRLASIFIILIAGWIGCVLSSACSTQESGGIRWASSFEEAKKRAKSRKIPILVAINKTYDLVRDREKHDANKKMVTVTYRDPAVVKISRKFVCIFASPDDHAKPDGGPGCSHADRLTCQQHKALFERIRADHFGGDKEIMAPQHLILNPDGRIIDKYLLDRKPDEFVRILKNALARFKGQTPVDVITADPRSVIKGLKSDDSGVRSTAFRQAVGILGGEKKNSKVKDAAEQYLRTMRRDWRNMRDAMEAISQAGTEGALELLLPALKNKRENVRRRVLDVFASSPPYKKFIKPLGQCVRSEKSKSPLQSLVKVLDKYATEIPEALPVLNKLVSNKLASIKVLATFAAARPGNKAIVGKLQTRARAEANVKVRIAAILGLAMMNAKETLSTLVRVRKKVQKPPTLISALDTAIARLGGRLQLDSTKLEDEVRRAKQESESKNPRDDRRGEGRGGDGRGGGRKGKGGRGGGRGGR